MPASVPSANRWLLGPIPDLLLGCGGLYACVVLAFAVEGSHLRGAIGAWLGPLLVLLLGAPHYGATLIRVHDQRADRRAYAIFSVYATLAILGFLAASLYSWVLATWLVTLYLTWSPWHYTGQNYGLAVMFLGRRGVDFDASTKRLLYASFILSYVLTFLTFHGPTDSNPSPEFGSGLKSMFVSIEIPDAVTGIAFPALLLVNAICLVVVGAKLLRRAALRDLVPTAALVGSQALWFTIPMVVRHWQIPVGVEPLRWDLRDFYFYWIALAHSTQYIWVTAFYARRSRRWRGTGWYLAKILVAGTAVWSVPAMLLDLGFVGELPNFSKLALLTASAVNVHHFVLDGAIWKLRSTRVADVLIRRADPSSLPVSPGAPTTNWRRRVVWCVASMGCAAAFFTYAHKDVLFPRAVERNDIREVRTILMRLDWLHDVSQEAWRGLVAAEAAAGLASARRGDWSAAVDAYQAALQTEPENAVLLRGASRAWVQLGEPDRAIPLLERLVDAHPDDAGAHDNLAAVRRLAQQPSP